ncbi:putative membrane protein SirB2 [Chitinivorax tropicus]|uniref:Putative membrane protein SirB2 n=1 Tax=Chitinivorax tropicus TaxID=714531 RepID=A0A840MS41_9PROT|nr:SirB2 family protein [Chitinivorax tropicus]MBB5020235.1 putative membrane protein SirB2 [Chitinivorax tropicus]
MPYIALKHLHMTFAAISISLFLLRGYWMWQTSPRLQQRWVKVVPHINDTALLGTAIAMVIWSRQYPFVMDWLTAKLLALILYIVLGSIALKRGRTKPIRLLALLGATLTFTYIVGVALTKSPVLAG